MVEEFLVKNSYLAFIIYIVIKDGIPLIKSILDKTIPASLARKKSAEEKANELKALELEQADRKIDVDERHIIALEQIGKTLISQNADHKLIENMIRDNQSHNQAIFQTMSTNLAAANQGLVLLLDRNQRYRKADNAKAN